MIAYVEGDLFETGRGAIVNTVNCVGVMGKGVALGVRDRWPGVFAAYRRDCAPGFGCDGGRDARLGGGRDAACPSCCRPGGSCKTHRVRPGAVTLRPTGSACGVLAVIDLPTKRHWREPSRLDDVAAGLDALAALLREGGPSSVAMTAPGCGNGGLRWADVRPIVEAALGPLAARVDVHAPPR